MDKSLKQGYMDTVCFAFVCFFCELFALHMLPWIPLMMFYWLSETFVWLWLWAVKEWARKEMVETERRSYSNAFIDAKSICQLCHYMSLWCLSINNPLLFSSALLNQLSNLCTFAWKLITPFNQQWTNNVSNITGADYGQLVFFQFLSG